MNSYIKIKYKILYYDSLLKVRNGLIPSSSGISGSGSTGRSYVAWKLKVKMRE